MMSLPSASGELFSSFIVSLHTTHLMSRSAGFYHHCPLCSLPLRLWQVDSVFAKLCRPLGEPASALGSFFRRRGLIDNPIDRLCCKLPSTHGLAGALRFRLELQP